MFVIYCLLLPLSAANVQLWVWLEHRKVSVWLLDKFALDWISRTCNPITATDGLPNFSILLFLRDFGWRFWWSYDCSSNVSLVISKDPYVHLNRHSHHDVWPFKSAEIHRQRRKRRIMVQRITRLSLQPFVRWRRLITHNVCFTASCNPIHGQCSVSLLGGIGEPHGSLHKECQPYRMGLSASNTQSQLDHQHVFTHSTERE